MHSVDTLIKRYREKGYRITPQRQMIFTALAGDDSHPTAEDIYQRIKKQMPDLSRSTVYNTLNELVELGELHEVDDFGTPRIRYDINTSHHHHLYCVQCHKLIDIEQEIGPIDVPSEVQTGFRVQRSQVTFFGLCSDCQD
jgi:Fe2+ or Zn2+ uptake regulation protein